MCCVNVSNLFVIFSKAGEVNILGVNIGKIRMSKSITGRYLTFFLPKVII